MPTPVSSARQCLAAEAAGALDDAVSVARRRGHAQTTSLHVVYALLLSSSPSPSPSSASASASASSSTSPSSPSILRDALSRARSSAYSPRLQFKALELCFGVALDRLPSSTHHHHHNNNNQQAASSDAGASAGCDDPPLSNSLMAAIKRSQANQRRNPDTFHLYQQQQQQSCVFAGGVPSSTATTTFSGVKVELQQLILAILDDPVVSRVFGDAGFRSTDIKLAVLRPPPPILRFPRATRCPPLFLCNFSAGDGFEPALTPRGLVFPFASGVSNFCSDAEDENCRRIGEILCRKAGGRNPMLVGVGAGEAARDFAQALELQNWAVLPLELRGIKLVSIKKEMTDLRTSAGGGNSAYAGRLEELRRSLELPGTILSIGDLKEMVEREDEEDEQESFLVSEITRLLELHHGRLWVMGWSATYETYMKFLSRYPLLDKDWDLQLLPITSVRAAVAGSLPRTSSLMESFVPFGGFFPATYESKGLLSTPYPSLPRCKNCNEKYEQEVAVLKDHSGSAEDQNNPILPFWFNKANVVNLNQQFEAAKTQDDMRLLNSKINDLQKKWDDYCQRLHQSCNRVTAENSQSISCVIDPADGCNKIKVSDQTGSPDGTQNKRRQAISFPISLGLQTITSVTQGLSGPSFLDPRNKDLISKLQVEVPRSEQLQREGFGSQQVVLSDLGHYSDHASPASVTSVTTDLVLGTPGKEEKPASQAKKDMLENMPGCFASENVDVSRRSVQQVPVESSWSCSPSSQAKFSNPPILCHPVPKVSNTSSPYEQSSLVSSNMSQKFDISSYKSLYSSLVERVGRQEEVLSTISEAVIRCRSSERRRGGRLKGDIWLAFHGSDEIGKRRAALALAELIYGGKENFVCIDLSNQEGTTRPGTICNEEVIKGDDLRFRGKTNVDCIAAELRNKLCSVFFLENIHKADFIVQSILSQAIRTGKFRDSYGREFTINNAIFILNKASSESKIYSHRKDDARFCEESILGARFWQMKMFVEPCPESLNNGRKANVSMSPRHKSSSTQLSSCSVFLSKRKLDAYEYCRSECEALGPVKRTLASSTKSVLDLNLPVQETEEAPINADTASAQTDSQLDNSDSWIEDFLDMLDATVSFQPFDFDALSDSIMMDLSKFLCRAASSDCMLEIDPKVMEQILAAAWSSGNREALNNWLHQVLVRSFIELSRRCKLSAQNVIRLVVVEDEHTEKKQADGILLPRRIIID